MQTFDMQNSFIWIYIGWGSQTRQTRMHIPVVSLKMTEAHDMWTTVIPQCATLYNRPHGYMWLCISL